MDKCDERSDHCAGCYRFLLDIHRPDRYTYRTFGVYMSEVTEMLIGIVGVLYVWLKARMFRSEWDSQNSAST